MASTGCVTVYPTRCVSPFITPELNKLQLHDFAINMSVTGQTEPRARGPGTCVPGYHLPSLRDWELLEGVCHLARPSATS